MSPALGGPIFGPKALRRPCGPEVGREPAADQVQALGGPGAALGGPILSLWPWGGPR